MLFHFYGRAIVSNFSQFNVSRLFKAKYVTLKIKIMSGSIAGLFFIDVFLIKMQNGYECKHFTPVKNGSVLRLPQTV